MHFVFAIDDVWIVFLILVPLFAYTPCSGRCFINYFYFPHLPFTVLAREAFPATQPAASSTMTALRA